MGRVRVVEQSLWRSPASSMRGAIDSLAQGSLVDLFAAYDVAVAPVPRVPGHLPEGLPEITAAIAFSRHEQSGQGQLTLSLPPPVFCLMKQGEPDALASDWARELANQLIGRLKNRLLQLSVRLQLGASSIVDSFSLVQQIRGVASTRIYTARTLRGEVVMTLRGMPDESELRYAPSSPPVAEGSGILFE
jgi:hypothetical protein